MEIEGVEEKEIGEDNSRQEPVQRAWGATRLGRQSKKAIRKSQACMQTEENEDSHTRPYQACYFLPGRVEGKSALYLLDTGSNTNLMSKKFFDQLPARIREQMTSCETYGAMADGTKLPFYGIVQATGRLRDVHIQDTFVVSQINEDIILGMPFLVKHECQMLFDKPLLRMGDRELACTDRYGRLLACKVQVFRKITLAPEAETTIRCKVVAQNYAPLGLIEKNADGVLVATSVKCPTRKGEVFVRCLNLGSQPLELKPGSTIGTYTSIEKGDIQEQQDLLETAEADIRIRGVNKLQQQGDPQIASHLEALYHEAANNCRQPGQKQVLGRLLEKYKDVFSRNDGDVGRTTLVEHSIPTEPGARPVRLPPHRLGPQKEMEADKQVAELLEKGLIAPASGAWSSPVVLVRKKDNKWRFCIDYRKLNSITLQDAYPIPRIDDSLDALAGSKYFSTLDLTSGYWQVPLDKEAQEKSAFTTRTGLWKWKVLPFGLTSAPATFQRLMEKVLQGLHWKTLLLYMDDIIVVSPDFDTHISRLEEVLQRLQKAGLKLKPTKCKLLQDQVEYLGHVVSAQGVATDPKKIEAIKDWPTPKDMKGLQAFLGLAGYYRQYIQDYATIAKPLTVLTGKGVEWKWGMEAENAFQELKRRLINAPILSYPDPKLPYILDTDASAVGVGAVLSQVQDEEEKVVAYFSKTLSPAERNYCVTRRELLAVVKATKHFKPYLYGQKFKLRTDHASLRWLCRRKEPSAQVARWLEILAEFQYSLEHRAGMKHNNADGLSRRGWCTDCKQCDNIERRDGGPTHQEIASEDALSGELPYRVEQRQEDEINHISSPSKEVEQLVKAQSEGRGSVALIYQHLQGQELSRETLQMGNEELRRLHQRIDSMRIRNNGVLEIYLNIQDKGRWCTVCPDIFRRTVMWDTHGQVHSGIQRTLHRIRLNWYWPGMTASVRNLINTCEVCQMAKTGGKVNPGSRQRMYAGRPWQKVAVDLVGPFPETIRGNKWVLVVMDHFTRWQDAIALPDATAPTVASTLDERIFCYMGLPENIHSDQGAQFEGQLMSELCQLWKVEKTRTTPYHPQANGMVERNNRALGDALRTLLLKRGQEEWDLLLPHIMRAFRGTPHSTTRETPKMLMFGRELRLPDQLQVQPPPVDLQQQHPYLIKLQERLEEAHQILRERQFAIRQGDSEEPLLFAPQDLVLLENKRRRKGDNPKLQSKFVGPYLVIRAFPNHTYKIRRQGQDSVQSEGRLKRYRPCQETNGQAPGSQELPRRPNMKGATRNTAREDRTNTDELSNQLPPIINQEANNRETIQPIDPPTGSYPSGKAPQESPEGELEEQDTTGGDQTPANESNATSTEIRPRRTVNVPQRYGNYLCHHIRQEGTKQNLLPIGGPSQNKSRDILQSLTEKDEMNSPKTSVNFPEATGRLNPSLEQLLLELQVDDEEEMNFIEPPTETEDFLDAIELSDLSIPSEQRNSNLLEIKTMLQDKNELIEPSREELQPPAPGRSTPLRGENDGATKGHEKATQSIEGFSKTKNIAKGLQNRLPEKEEMYHRRAAASDDGRPRQLSTLSPQPTLNVVAGSPVVLKATEGRRVAAKRTYASVVANSSACMNDKLMKEKDRSELETRMVKMRKETSAMKQDINRCRRGY